MEELTRLQASRQAHKAHVTRLINKSKEILTKENPDEIELSSLNTSFEQLVRKRNSIGGNRPENRSENYKRGDLRSGDFRSRRIEL